MEKNKSVAPQVTVCGIGASAGGIEALRQFFASVPVDLGIAYVVVVHLAPEHESDLASILGRCTKMPVREVPDGDKLALKPDSVYVISPDRKLEIDHTSIGASPFTEQRERRAPIDVFFRSLAANHGDGFALILSGGGSDGAVGAKAVKEAGGVVLVQDPREATHEGMPRSVIAADIADVVLPIKEIAARLAELSRHKAQLAPLIRPAREPEIDEGGEAALKRIFDIVRSRTGHDFARYKTRHDPAPPRAADAAQPQRRLRPISRLPAGEPRGDRSALRRSVDHGHHVLPRSGSVGSATNPCRRAAARAQRTERPDSDLGAGLRDGRGGLLARDAISRGDQSPRSAPRARDLRIGRGPGRARDGARRHLPRRDRGGRLRSAPRALLPCGRRPFQCCERNPRFGRIRRAQRAPGSAVLEAPLDLAQELADLSGPRAAAAAPARLPLRVCATTVFCSSGFPRPRTPRCSSRSTSSTGSSARARAAGPPMQLPAVPPMPATVERARSRGLRMHRAPVETHIEMLEHFAPPSVLIDEHWNVEHLSETAGRFLQPRGGPPTQAVTDLARPELLDELRATLHHASELHEQALSAFVPVRFNGTARLVAVLVQPRRNTDGSDTHFLITFLEAGEVRGDSRPPERSEATDSVVLNLREKLRIAEQRLESMRLEHSMAYEDLRAANEELQSLNEEYRSTTEELETSKEELQSVNEELQTVNHELKMKLEEVSRANNDLENFMAATDIPMLFLDRALSIKRYTAALRDFFSVKPHDAGRPIGDLTHTLQYEDLEKDAAKVLADLTPIVRTIRTRDGANLTVRIRPYRTAEDKIDGVVVTFMR